MSIKCHSCQTENDELFVFCSNCGAKLQNVNNLEKETSEQEEMSLSELIEKEKAEKKEAEEREHLNFSRDSLNQQRLKKSGKMRPKKSKTKFSEEDLEKAQKYYGFRAKRDKIDAANLDGDLEEDQINGEVEEVYQPQQESESEDLAQNILSPIVNYDGSISEVYNEYKRQKKLPFFFFALSGVAALLFGFGYFLQYSVSQFFSGIVKSTLTLALSFCFYFFGYKLFKNKNKYHEFGSVLLGVGVVLGYMLIYYLSTIKEYPLLSDASIGFGLTIINTLIATFFSVRCHTRLVSIITLFGGAFLPYFLYAEIGTSYYFNFLWLLAASSLYVSQYIPWKTLSISTLGVITAIIEVYIFYHLETLNFTHLVLFHSFLYLFLYFFLFSRASISISSLKTDNNERAALPSILKRRLFKIDIILISAVLTFFCLNLFYYFQEKGKIFQLGLVYLVNLIPFLTIFLIQKKKASKEMQKLLIMIIGVLVAFAIPALIGLEVLSIVWACEAILLIYLGFVFQESTVRKEGYVILAVAIGKIIYTLPDIYFEWNDIFHCFGYYNFIVLGIIFWGLMALLSHNKIELTSLEEKVLKISRELFPICFTLLFILTAASFTYRGLAFLSLIPCYFLIYRGQTSDLIISKILGYILYATTLVYACVWIYTSMSVQWGITFFSNGYLNLFTVGALLISMRYWYVTVSAISFDKSKITITDTFSTGDLSIPRTYKNDLGILLEKIFSLWIAFTFILSIAYFTTTWLPALMLVPTYILLYSGYTRNRGITILLGYFIYAVGFILAFTQTFRDIPTNAIAVHPFSPAYANLFTIGLYLFSLRMLYFLTFRKQKVLGLYEIRQIYTPLAENWQTNILTNLKENFRAIFLAIRNLRFKRKEVTIKRSRQNEVFDMALEQFFSFWISYFFIRTAYFYIGIYAWCLLIIPMFGLILWGGKRKLIFTEWTGISHIFIMLGVLFYSFYQSGSLHWYDQALYGKILIFEIYFCLWFLKSFYSRFLKDSPQRAKMNGLNTFFFIVLPFIPVFFVNHYLNEYTIYAWWIAVLVSFTVTEVFNHKNVLYILYIITFIASIYSFVTYDFVAVLVGFLILTGITILKKGLVKRIEKKEDKHSYEWLPTLNYFYTGGFVYMFVYSQITLNHTGALFAASAFFFITIFYRKHIYPVRVAHKAAYRVSYFLLFLGLIILLLIDYTPETMAMPFYERMNWSFIFLLFASIYLHNIIYHHNKLEYKGEKKILKILSKIFNILFVTNYVGKSDSGIWKTEIIVLHFYYVASYIAFIYYLTHHFVDSEVSVVMNIHAVILLFRSINPKYKILSKISVWFFILGIGKMLFFDLASAPMSEKITVLSIMGVVLLTSAFLYIKIKARYEKVEENTEDDEALEVA